jgi:hypothetical protein
MRIDKKHYTISFDRFSRQSRAFDVIESLREKGQRFKILDVGGYRGITQKLHVNDDVTILDVYDVSDKGYIKGDGLNMQFEDNAFDFVVSFDVFEHIPDKDRQQFITESCRVAGIAVITAAPIATEANVKAEAHLNSLHKKLYGKEHEWLKEHHEYGLPRPNQAKNIMEDLGLKTAVFGSNDTVLWTLMQGAVFLNAKFTEGQKSILDLNKLYNQTAYNDGTADPLESYRHVVCGFKAQGKAQIAMKYLEKNSRAISVPEKVDIAERITEHYMATMLRYTRLYESLYDKFTDKIEEKEILQKTIDGLSSRVDAINSSRTYKIAQKLQKINKLPHKPKK